MNTKRVNYISFINVFAAVSVVVLHSNSSFWNYSTDAYWGITNVIESVLYCAVPLFFMLTYTFVSVAVFERTQEYLISFIFIGLTSWDFFQHVVRKSKRKK